MADNLPTDDVPRAASATRFTRFSLAFLFAATTIIAVAIAFGLEMNKSDIVALLRVRRSFEDILPSGDRNLMEESEYRQYCTTQIELLRSDYVLMRALRSPGIISLPMINGRNDAVAFLRHNLKISMLPNSELIEVKLRVTEPREGEQIVDAVIASYFREVVDADRTARLVAETNLQVLNQEARLVLSRHLDNLSVTAKATRAPTEKLSEVLARPLFELDLKELEAEIEYFADIQRAIYRAKSLRDRPPRISKIQPAQARP